ncbi:MAG: hypothetical protein J6K32_03855 [Clostridia bacterium]|nr:hypothetical protein [Clostridia bacterium]
MKHLAAALLIAALLIGAMPALAQEATYVFPYEGFRYTQKAGETVLTQTNLDEHEALIESLGTTKEAILASYIASGIVMEVIPQDGGQIAVSVVSAGGFKDVMDMAELNDERLAAFAAQFEESGLYESCSLISTTPVCVRLTSSAMYASMPVYTLRYATLHLGKLYMISQTIVGRAPEAADDERMEEVLSGIKLLSTLSAPTPEPTPAPTATPVPTPEPTPGVAPVIASMGEMTVEGVPAYTNDPQISITGRTEASASVRAVVNDKTLGMTTAKRDGTFALTIRLPGAGEHTLAVMTDKAEQMLSITYEKPLAKLEILEPTETVFTGTNVIIKGRTEPDATVFISGKGTKTNVQANRNGAFSIRVFIDSEESVTFSLRAKAEDHTDHEMDLTLTRVFTEREGIAAFRQKMRALEYDSLHKDPARYADVQFVFRGKVMDFADYNGSPCALLCVDNVATGVWKDPVWVILEDGMEIAVGQLATIYMTGEGQTLPASGEHTRDGMDTEAPVTRAKFMTEITDPS